MAKDHFSGLATEYARYRPRYPKELFGYIDSLMRSKENCWDCATGNGQLAEALSNRFQNVYATDISKKQINQAPKLHNIYYSVQSAENVNFPDHFFELITVGQAVHWFDFEAFYQEVRRTAKPGAVIILTGYGLVQVNSQIDPLIHHFYEEVIGDYWDPERRFIEEEYQTIPFPFKELETPEFHIECDWNLHHFISYINTWSAVKRFKKASGNNPIPQFEKELSTWWPSNKVHSVTFPLLLRVGQL